MQRQFEIIHKPRGTYSRLTITPARVSLKLVPGNPNNEELVAAAKAIADRHQFDKSVRGAFIQPGQIRLVSEAYRKGRTHGAESFSYNYKGELLP